MSRADDQDDLDEELIDLAEELDYRDRVDIEEREQTVGTLKKMFDEEQLDQLPDDEILETSGILSHVREDEETRPRPDDRVGRHRGRDASDPDR